MLDLARGISWIDDRLRNDLMPHRDSRRRMQILLYLLRCTTSAPVQCVFVYTGRFGVLPTVYHWLNCISPMIV